MVEFNRHPKKLAGGECYYREGDPQSGIRSAPHDAYDPYSADILRDLAESHPKSPYVYCTGYRGVVGKKLYNVNRPTGGENPKKAGQVMQKYFESQVAANRGKTPKKVHEIHTKSDYRHSRTEITLIGNPDHCGWSPTHLKQAKQLWQTHTDQEPYVYGLDPEASYGHQSYQKIGLAGIHHYCGINIELSKQDVIFWTLKPKETDSEKREKLLKALHLLFEFGDGGRIPDR